MSDKTLLREIADENESDFNTMLYIQNNLDTVKTSLIHEYWAYIQSQIFESLRLSPKWEEVKSNTRSKIEFRHITGLVSVRIGFSAPPFNNLSYAIIPASTPASKEVYSGLHSELHTKYKLGIRSPFRGESSKDCPLYVWYDQGLNWMNSTEFLKELYKFTKAPDGSECKKKADAFIYTMFEDLKSIDALFPS